MAPTEPQATNAPRPVVTRRESESLPTETLLKRAFRKKAVECHPVKGPLGSNAIAWLP